MNRHFGIAVLTLVLATLARPADAAFINHSAKEINVKIVYVGSRPDANGATLKYIYGRTAPKAKGKLIRLETNEAGAVTFFDFTPLKLGKIRGYTVRFHLYTVDGAHSEKTRQLILKGADGVVFVANAGVAAKKVNLSALENLKGDLKAQGYAFDSFPLSVQVDAIGAKKTVALDPAINVGQRPVVEADSTTGKGVFEVLKTIAKQTLLELKKGSSK